MTYRQFLEMLDELQRKHPDLHTIMIARKSYDAFYGLHVGALNRAGLEPLMTSGLIDENVTNINGIDVRPSGIVPVGVACLFGPGQKEIGVIDRRPANESQQSSARARPAPTS